MAVVATLSKGYDLDYIWKQVDRGPAKDAASYYIQASETGGEPPGRWWGSGARALGFEPGQTVERKPYDLLFGGRKAPDGTQLGRPPNGGRKAADIYALLLAAEPYATAERRRELRTEAVKKARQSPLFFDLTISLFNDLTAQRRAFADKLANHQSLMVPAEDPDYGDLGQAFPPWPAPARQPILQPPRPEIQPSEQILERAADRETDWEAAD